MNIHRTVGIVALFAVSLTAIAQSQDFDPAAYPSFGDVGVEEYQPLEGDAEQEGALVFVATTPGGQAAEVNLTGPDGIRFDFVLETDGETVLSELPTGIYSVAATDESMQLAEGKVAVRQGQRGFVSIALVPIPDFHYDLADYGPYGDVEVSAYEPLGETDSTGSLLIATNLPDEAELHVTGPDGYRSDFIGNVILTNLTLSDLDPGPYSIAATAEGYALTEGKVEVRAGELVEVRLILAPLDATGGSAGGPEEPVVIRLGDRSVTEREFDGMFRIAMRSMAAHRGMPLDEEMRSEFARFRPAYLAQVATQVVLLDEAERRGIDVSAQEVEERMRVVRQNFEGEVAFQEFLDDAGFRDEAQLRSFIRDLATVATTVEDMRGDVEVTAAQIQDYYDENREAIGRPLEDVRAQIRDRLARHRLAETIAALREQSGVEVFPPGESR